MKKILNILTIFGCFFASAQMDTTFTIIAKMDVDPQFELHDGTEIEVMGYTQLIGAPIDLPGPTIVLEEGDSVRINLWNFSQGADHTIHLHGLDVNQQNDGVPMLSFGVAHDEIAPYFLKVPHPGMYLYHCHETSVLHVQAGMYGMLIVKPKDQENMTWENGFQYTSETNWLFSEIDIDWHHDTMINHGPLPVIGQHQLIDYDPNYFLVNGRSDTQLENENIQISGNAGSNTILRLANVGYYGNRVILPADLNAKIISSDGRILPSFVETDSIEILPGERYSVLLSPTSNFTTTCSIEYFNLNTQEVEGVQTPKVAIDYPVGIQDQSQLSLQVYPNPSDGEVYIESNLNSGWIQVCDLYGKQLETIKIKGNKQKLNLDVYSNGIYMIHLVSGKEKITKFITLNK